MPTMPTYKKIATRFRHFKKNMYDCWEAYVLLQYYLPQVHDSVKAGDMSPLRIKQVIADSELDLTVRRTLGAISHITQKASSRSTILTSVSHFENYLCDLCMYVFRDYPQKISASDTTETDDRREKLSQVIFDSSSREEIIERLIEEKVRGIFYGNPIDFFTKDKAKLEFGTEFSSRFQPAITNLAEVIARRNIIAHNDGRIDRKYLREVRGSTARLGEIVQLDANYLREAIDLMLGIASTATHLVNIKIYNGSSNSRLLAKFYSRFYKKYPT